MYLKEGKIVTIQEDDYTKITACRGLEQDYKVIRSSYDGLYYYFNIKNQSITTRGYSTLGQLIMWTKSDYIPYYDGVEMDLKHGTI